MSILRPRISVVMAARNSEATIGAALGSLLRQSVPADEIIIVDDASTDGTARKIRDMADGRVRLFRNDTQRGVACSLNAALAHAGGDLVARMDADDICLADRFEAQVAYLRAHPEIDLVGTWVRTIDADGHARSRVNLPAGHAGILGYAALSPPFRHPSLMVRREVLDRLDPVYDPALEGAEDYDLWARLLPRHRAANIARPLLLYRVHARAVSVERRSLQAGAHAIAARRYAGGMTGRDDLDEAVFKGLAEWVVLRWPMSDGAIGRLLDVLARVNLTIRETFGTAAARQAAAEQRFVLLRLALRSSPAAARICLSNFGEDGGVRSLASLGTPLLRDLSRLAGTLRDRVADRRPGVAERTAP